MMKGNKTYLTPELKEINDTLKVFVERNIFNIFSFSSIKLKYAD
jgi:hypothetical protein